MLEATLTTDLKLFVQEIHKKLGGVFAPKRPIFIVRVPGLLQIMGPSCSSGGGLSIQTQQASAIILAVQRRLDQRILIRNLNLNRERILTFEYRLDDFAVAAQNREWATIQNLFAQPDRHWTGHILGALSQIISHFPGQKNLTGFNIAISSSLPAGAGLGSSSALQAGLVLAFKEALKLPIEPLQLAEISAAVESQIMQQPSTFADYVSILNGQKNKALVLHCHRKDKLNYYSIPSGFRFVALDTGIRKHPGWQKHNEFQIALQIGCSILKDVFQESRGEQESSASIASVSLQEWQSLYRKMVPYRKPGQFLFERENYQIPPGLVVDPQKNYMPRSVMEYVIEENDRSEKFIVAIEQAQGDQAISRWQEAGDLMFDSHRQFAKLGGTVCEQAEWTVNALRVLGADQGIYGARALPGGMGSSVVILAADNTNDILQNLVSQYQDRFGNEAQLLTGSAAGVLESGVMTTEFE